MPYYPRIPEIKQKQILTRAFLGYNRNPEIGEGQNNVSPQTSQEFYDMENLCGDYYPMMASRKKRGMVKQLVSPGGCTVKDELIYVDNGKLYYDGEAIPDLELSEGEKQFLSMGAYLVIWPDKVAVNMATKKYEFFAPITDAVVTAYNSSTHSVTASTYPVIYNDILTDMRWGGSVLDWQPFIATYGKDINAISYNADTGEWTLPTVVWKGIWKSGSSQPFPLIEKGDIMIPSKIVQSQGIQFHPNYGTYVGGTANYPEIENNTQGFYALYEGWDGQQSIYAGETRVQLIADVYRYGLVNSRFADSFKVGDILNITNDDKTVNSISNRVTAIDDTTNTITFEKEIEGIPSSIPTEYHLKITLPVPDMDYITEASNRIWGCKYGEVDGQTINEIYACALGDYRAWYKFKGISTDSYVASVGTDGKWTGAATYQGNPIFFKENYFHKVYVSSGGAHQITDLSCRGVQDGCHNSLAFVGDRLMYKSRSGVMIYDGSLPVSVSAKLGDINYHDAVAGSIDDKYYISMCDDDNKWSLFVYDASKGLWYREDSTHAMSFARVRNELYYIDFDSKKIISVNGTDGAVEDAVDWRADTGLIGYTTPEQKYISRFNIRMQLPYGSCADLYIQYDSDGVWHHAGHMDGNLNNTSSFIIPVRPRRCDHFNVRLEGHGDVLVYSIAKIFEQGSDVV